ncbi:macro domain-containing protein [Salinisphaera sp. G21_0]|uniref:macro domain-containing protein n=1 Tax=Salinisphaera sp. G21_0 TaxID=2821094 RepID=UPI001ADBF039|nr:macro domain-containing protein [Salinisphaera sp. G21_0]MBO9479801.1 macro domain-containing protein [Salinisphaera sp. G21_0]
MYGAIRNFCDQVCNYGPLELQKCGINKNNQFVCGRTVDSIDNKRLLVELTKYPTLEHIIGKTTVSKHELPVNYHNLASVTEKTLPGGRVTLVTCHEGLLAWAGRKNGEKAYGIVSSVDQYMKLDRGIAEAITSRLGGHGGQYHHWASRQPQINFGECLTFDFVSAFKPPELSNCQTVHNVLVPISGHRSFEAMLKKAVFEVFIEAYRRGLDRIFCPLLGCGRASGSGTALAKAVLAARDDFALTGRQPPELILVGRSSEAADIKACIAFDDQWYASTPASSLPVRNVTTPTSPGAMEIDTATSTGSGDNRSSVLIPGQLAIVMNPDNGMFGYARELSKQGIPFDLVNAANRNMSHGGGIALRFSNELGDTFNQATHGNAPVQTGICYTTGPHSYATDPKFGLLHCQHIHNVVAPNKGEYDVSVNSSDAGRKTHSELQRYQKDFTKAFVSLLLSSSNHGSNTIVSCFIGCNIFRGNGSDMAVALHGAYKDPRIKRLTKVPELILVGWQGKTDLDVYENFIRTFKSLNRSDSLSLPSGRTRLGAFPASTSDTVGVGGAIPKRTSPYFGSGTGQSTRFMPDVSAPEEKSLSRTNLFLRDALSPWQKEEVIEGQFPSGGKKVIDCGVCGESTPKKDSLPYQGVQVCRECSVYYRNQGHDLSAKLAEEYTAINYLPLVVFRSRRDLPGYEGAGRIVVGIDATAPVQLKSGRMLEVTHKNATHFLPDNELGNELYRLLEILHEEKLIYKIDKSNTTGKFGITFNVHLKTLDHGGEERHGYPDRFYPRRALDEIAGLAAVHGLQDKLDMSKLVSLVFGESS